jgi:hypothetical protein
MKLHQPAIEIFDVKAPRLMCSTLLLLIFPLISLHNLRALVVLLRSLLP